VRAWALPDEYRHEREARKAQGLPLPLLGTGSRGPATIMTSVLRPETVFFWCYDHPQLMQRFSSILATKMVELNRVLREFSGNTQPGWWITDDNCGALQSRALPRVLLPGPRGGPGRHGPHNARRYQHSDSAMGHLLEYQRDLGIRSVNYGPEVDVALIREIQPQAVINGHTPPFLLRDGSPDEIKARVLSDFQKAGGTGGLIVTTAGSLAAGTGGGPDALVHAVCAGALPVRPELSPQRMQP